MPKVSSSQTTRSLQQAAMMVLLLAIPISVAEAENRIALLIGNQNYNSSVGPLANPHNDIALVGTALEKLGFRTTLIKDVGYKAIETALRLHIQNVRRAGKNTISFIYYSGHGASDPDTKINYLIPIDVESADDASLWTNSLELSDMVNKLRSQNPEATHYVVFDACREELRLTRDGKKALSPEKGFVAVGSVTGVMIVYATAPGKTAADVGQGAGPYAKALTEEIVKPGIEAVTMFRNVQLKVKQAIGQDPWLSFPTLPAVYFAGSKSPERGELPFWVSVKDSTSPTVLATYLERYPNGEFASIARALIEHYERQLKAELAAREQDEKRQEVERRNREVRQLEDEQRAREAVFAEERKRAEKAQTDEESKRLEEQQRAELIVRTEQLRKALEEARIAREAAKIAEEQRLAAVMEAEKATKAADDAIAKKREANKTNNPAKVAALPKLDHPKKTQPKLDPSDYSRSVTPGGYRSCGRKGCQMVPKGCHAVRYAGGHGLGGKIFCP
jgi:hypothetical protein